VVKDVPRSVAFKLQNEIPFNSGVHLCCSTFITFINQIDDFIIVPVVSILPV
jgi:hypothetical protein